MNGDLLLVTILGAIVFTAFGLHYGYKTGLERGLRKGMLGGSGAVTRAMLKLANRFLKEHAPELVTEWDEVLEGKGLRFQVRNGEVVSAEFAREPGAEDVLIH